MKRITLIVLVILAVSWIGYSGYELFYKNTNNTDPKHVFCDLDGGVLLINRLTETLDADYLSKIRKNEFAALLTNMDTLPKLFPSIKIYASVNRNLLVLDNNSHWSKEDIKSMHIEDWRELSKEVFNKIFEKSAVKRTKYTGLKRNIDFLLNRKK